MREDAIICREDATICHDSFVVCLENCTDGLGMKICEELDENENVTGILVKQILNDGTAACSGKISEGDKILSVNDISLSGVRQTSAISYLRSAAKTGKVTLVLSRNNRSNFSNDPGVVSNRSSCVSTNNTLFLKNEANRENFQKKGNLTASLDSGYPHNSPLLSSHHSSENMSASNVKTIVLTRGSLPGISVEKIGNMIIVSDILKGGDVYLDGRIKVGDGILSVDGKSLIGMTLDDARSHLLEISDKKEYRISFIENLRQSRSGEGFLNTHDSSNNSVITSFTTKKPQQDYFSVSTPTERSLLREYLDSMSDVDDSERANKLADEIMELSRDNLTSVPEYTFQNSWGNDIIKTEAFGSINNNAIGTVVDRNGTPEFCSTNYKGFSLDPSTPIKLEKLETALKHLGIQISPSETKEIRRRLNSDSRGSVLYGDFVEIAKDVINKPLKNLTSINSSKSSNNFVTSSTPFKEGRKEESVSNGALIKQALKDELRALRDERDAAIEENRFLKASIRDKSLKFESLENELYRYKKELQTMRDQCDGLKRRIRFTESTHRTAKEHELAYENKIVQLENEIGRLRGETIPDKEELVELQKRSVVIGCQLRKAEVSKRTYEVVVSKLLNYVTRVETVLEKEDKRTNKTESLQRKTRKLEELKTGAADVIKVVNSLLEEDPLPYGWEEVFTPDGTKYYINHVNQMTSWSHPVSGVQRSSKQTEMKQT